MTPAPAIVFDLDGTLIDSVPDLGAAVNRTLAAEGQAPMPLGEIKTYVGDGAPVLVSRVMVARGIDPSRHKELTDRIVGDYTANAAVLTRIYPGVTEALTVLRERGHPLGICTNKPGGATHSVLAALKLDTYFDAVIAGDTLAERKPHPAPLLAAFEALGGPGLYVGDSEVDAATAVAAGCPFLLFSEGYLRVPREEIAVTAEFATFADLAALVAGMTVLQ